MPDITPPDPVSPASGPHSASSAYLGPYTAPSFDDEPPDWSEYFAGGPGKLWVIPETEITTIEPAIPVPDEVLAAAAAVDGVFEALLRLQHAGAVTAAVQACWLSLVGPRTCDCPAQHRWNCPMTPLWVDTVRELDTDPGEPLEKYRAYGDLKFLPIRITTREDHP